MEQFILDRIERSKATKVLDLSNLGLTSLPELPVGLKWLGCQNNCLTRLPELPVGLGVLYCHNNQLKTLPELPVSLNTLYCHNNQLTTLPELPVGLKWLGCHNNQLLIDIVYTETPQTYSNRLTAFESRKRVTDRARTIHEELVSVVWHPSRVEKWLDLGGWELIDSL